MLREAVSGTANPFYRGAVAIAFNESRNAERWLRGVIDAEPHSEQASEAYKLLARLYLRTDVMRHCGRMSKPGEKASRRRPFSWRNARS